MSNTTISKLASALKISSDKLISQLNDAGISVKNENDEISNDEKLTLLNHLRGSHGTKKEIKSPKKLTVNRRSQSELKLSGGFGTSRTVNVEIRKKKTYLNKESLIEEAKQEDLAKEEENLKNEAALQSEQIEEPINTDNEVQDKTKDTSMPMVDAPPTSEKHGKPSKKKRKKSKSNKSSNTFAAGIPNVVPSSASIWLWVGLGIAFLIVFMMAGSLDNKSSSKKKLKKINKQSNDPTGQNIIEKVWSGNETMAKTFWLYCILVTVVFSFIGGMLMPIIGIFVFIVPAIVIVWANIGLWNSSTNYKLVQLNKKQSYGWATAAKVFVVLNFITTLSQAGFLLRGF